VDAGRGELARRVDDARACGRFQVLPDGGDLAAPDEHVRGGERAVRGGQDRRVAYERILRRAARARRPAARLRRRGGAPKREQKSECQQSLHISLQKVWSLESESPESGVKATCLDSGLRTPRLQT